MKFSVSDVHHHKFYGMPAMTYVPHAHKPHRKYTLNSYRGDSWDIRHPHTYSKVA